MPSYYRHIQRGYGLGSIFKSIARFFFPFLRRQAPKIVSTVQTIAKNKTVKKAASALKKQAPSAVANIVGAALAEKNVKDTTLNELNKSKRIVGEALLSGQPKSKKRSTKLKKTSNKRSKTTTEEDA